MATRNSATSSQASIVEAVDGLYKTDHNHDNSIYIDV